MKISRLLASRRSLLRQVALANQAHGYFTLRRLAARIAAVPLHGYVSLASATPERPVALTALGGVAPSVLEEHFNDRDLHEFADALALALDRDFDTLSFDLSAVSTHFVPLLRTRLARARVVLDLETDPPTASEPPSARE